MRKVFRGGTDQRDAADVDLLDRLVEGRAVSSHGRFERIQVDDDQPHPRQTELRALAFVRWIVAVGHDRAEEIRVQRFDPSVKERREAGQFADVASLNAVLGQIRARPAGRIQRHMVRCKGERQADDPASIGNREDRRVAGDGFSRQVPLRSRRPLAERSNPSR